MKTANPIIPKPEFLKYRIPAVILLWLCLFSGKQDHSSIQRFADSFATQYLNLSVPDIAYDYRDYFNAIPPKEKLDQQEEFFNKMKQELASFERQKLKIKEQVIYDHLSYEIDFNLQRVSLEKDWVDNGRQIPVGGLHELKNYKEWYAYFIKKFTCLSMTPEEVMALGEREVKRVQEEIRKIQVESGYTDSAAFYKYLAGDAFCITDKRTLINAFEKTDSAIRKNLPAFVGDVNVPQIYPMEWPDAGSSTPPGIYINHGDNPYGKDVFQYNFYGGKFNRRNIDWLYMHEAIPGHHLQFSFWLADNTDSLKSLFTYPGNFEGWACYVEYEGKELGVYNDLYSCLGKWEWDLVRSARLVLDAGIHYKGWTREQALDYWKKNIPGQDAIADREITRVTNWVAQTLSYKAGADCIMHLKEAVKNKHGQLDEKKFNRCYLSFGMRPLEVIVKNFECVYAG